MDEPIFAGVEPGGYHDAGAVRVLLCWVLSQAGGRMERESLRRVIQSTGLVNYFTLCCGIEELSENGLSVREGDSLCLSAKGSQAARELGASLPVSVKETLLEEIHCAASSPFPANVKLLDVPGGVLVRLTLEETNYCPMELTLYTPDEASAKEVAGRFSENPSAVYEAILKKLT